MKNGSVGSTGVLGRVSSYTPASDDAQTLLDALSQDIEAYVVILDDRGVFRHANKESERLLGKPVDEIVGSALGDFFDPDWTRERLSFVRRAIETREPVVTLGICGGTWNRATYRALTPGEDGEPRVLVVCRPTAEDTRSDGAGGVIRAKFHDLGPLSALTPREMDVLRLIGEGLSTSDIAHRLHRSAKTVEWHRVSLGNKLGVSNRVELARIAIRAGLSKLNPQDFRP